MALDELKNQLGPLRRTRSGQPLIRRQRNRWRDVVRNGWHEAATPERWPAEKLSVEPLRCRGYHSCRCDLFQLPQRADEAGISVPMAKRSGVSPCGWLAGDD